MESARQKKIIFLYIQHLPKTSRREEEGPPRHLRLRLRLRLARICVFCVPFHCVQQGKRRGSTSNIIWSAAKWQPERTV